MSAAFDHSAGPRDARIAFVGEAWGAEEEKLGRPFIGASGQEFTRILADAGLDRSACFITNTLALRPPDNNIEALCVRKAEVPPDYQLPPLRQGYYLAPAYQPELSRLCSELRAVNPNIVVALGATACWALLGTSAIGSRRGVVAESTLVQGLKVLPTYHPAAVLRNWSYRVVVVADLLKAKREASRPGIVRPEREVIVNPSLAEILDWTKRPTYSLSVDIETAFRQITMIGFARSAQDALVIPFVDMAKPSKSYWDSLEAELMAWGVVAGLLARPCPKTFQNGLYDLQYILRMGFRPVNVQEDTMLLHHALYPELQKGLGFLGSIYTNESSWKLMRNDTGKRDE